MNQIFDLEKLKSKLKKPWTPINVCHINNCVLKAALFKGQYRWHTHKNKDEFFLVYEGEITIDTEDGEINLKAGQGTVIPKGLRHKPHSKTSSLVLMFEPK